MSKVTYAYDYNYRSVAGDEAADAEAEFNDRAWAALVAVVGGDENRLTWDWSGIEVGGLRVEIVHPADVATFVAAGYDVDNDEVIEAASYGAADALEGGWPEGTDEDPTEAIAERATAYYVTHLRRPEYSDEDNALVAAAFREAFIDARIQAKIECINLRTA